MGKLIELDTAKDILTFKFHEIGDYYDDENKSIAMEDIVSRNKLCEEDGKLHWDSNDSQMHKIRCSFSNTADNWILKTQKINPNKVIEKKRDVKTHHQSEEEKEDKRQLFLKEFERLESLNKLRTEPSVCIYTREECEDNGWECTGFDIYVCCEGDFSQWDEYNIPKWFEDLCTKFGFAFEWREMGSLEIYMNEKNKPSENHKSPAIIDLNDEDETEPDVPSKSKTKATSLPKQKQLEPPASYQDIIDCLEVHFM